MYGRDEVHKGGDISLDELFVSTLNHILAVNNVCTNSITEHI